MAKTTKKKPKYAFKHGDYVALDIKVAGIGTFSLEDTNLPEQSILILRFTPTAKTAGGTYVAIAIDTQMTAHGKTVEDALRGLVYALKNAMDGKKPGELYNWLVIKSKAGTDANICGHCLWDLFNEFKIMHVAKKGISEFAGQKIGYGTKIRNSEVYIRYHIAKGCKAY